MGFALCVLSGCPGPDDPPLEPTYENVENIVRESCSFTVSCHGGLGRGKARLNFASLLDEGIPITTVLNGEPSCEYNRMPRIDPGHPENSWLMIKIAGAHNGAALNFTPDADWDPMVASNTDGTLRASTCPLTVEGRLSFGEIMPMGGQMSPNRLKAFREWIEMGAPGPEGYDAGVDDAGVTDAGPLDATVVDMSVVDMSIADMSSIDMSVADMSVADMSSVDMLTDASTLDATPSDASSVDASSADATVDASGARRR